MSKPDENNNTFNNTFHGYESGVLVYKKELTGAVYDGEPGALWSRTEYNTYLNGLKVGIYTEEESGDDYRSKGNGKENDNSKIVGGGAETHNYYCSYDGQGNISQLSNMAGDMPYNIYAYDSYGTQTGDDYYNEDFSGYKGYDKGPFGYKTGVRHYDPETGRFLSPDPFKGYMTDPSSQHPYMYCHGNPVEFSDPSGYLSKSEWEAIGQMGWGLVMIIGGAAMTQADSPLPGPGDVIGGSIVVYGTNVAAGASIALGGAVLSSQAASKLAHFARKSYRGKGKGPDQVATRIKNAVRNFNKKSYKDKIKAYNKFLKETLPEYVNKYKNCPGGNEAIQELRFARGVLKEFQKILEKSRVQFGPGGEIIR